MHNDLLLPGDWHDPTVLVAALLGRLDVLSSQSVNGDDGGRWEPRAPIAVGRAGLILHGPSEIIGGVQTQRGGRLALGDNDFPTLSRPRTRSVLVPCIPSLGGHDQFHSQFEYVPELAAARCTAGPNRQSYLSIALDTWVHDGSLLSTSELTFRVGEPPVDLIQQPSFVIARLSRQSANSLADWIVGGQLSPASLADLYRGGQPQTLLGTPVSPAPNQPPSNRIDLANYSYVVLISDSAGPQRNTHNIYHSLRLDFSDIRDLRFQ
jgi:hypothetical protein